MDIIKHTRSLLTLSAMLLTLWMLPPTASSQDTADGSGASDLAIDTITVTARKREEDSQTVPVAVTAIAPSTLQNEGAVDLRDLEGRVPNLVLNDSSAAIGGTSISIRGLSFEDVERSFEPTVGVVIDGVFLATSSAQLTNTFDFESIEVLRGPQGTLFGRNTIGGVISVRRTAPTREFGARVRATLGEFGREELGAVVNTALGSNGGLKLFAFNRELDGYFDNTTLGGSDGANDYRNFGATIDYDLTPSINALVTIESQEFSGQPSVVSLSQSNADLICSGIPGVLPPFASGNDCDQSIDQLADRFETTSEFDDSFDLDEVDVTAELTWAISDMLSIKSITGYRESDELQTQDFDGTAANFFTTSRQQDYQQLTEEVQLNASFNDRFSGVFGFFFLDSEYELFQETDSPLFFDATLMSPGQITANVFQETLSYAFFADVDFDLSDRMRLNLGGRYTRDEKQFRINNRIRFPAVSLTIPLFDTTDAATLPSNVSINGDGLQEADFSDFSPRISLDYQFADGLFGYVSWSQGFRSGGFNGRAGTLVAATTVYEPEDVDAFEVGIKTDFLGGRARFNVATFYSEYADRQEEIVIPINVAPFQETVVLNASDSTFWGIEMDGQIVISENLRLSASASYLDAEFDSFPILSIDPGTGDAVTLDQSNLTIRRAPEITYSIAALYTAAIGAGDLTASVSYRFVDDFQTTIVNANPNVGPQIDPPVSVDTNGPAFNDPRGVSEEQGTLNVSVGYGFDWNSARVNLSLFGRNLTDDVGVNSALPVAGLFTFATLDSPREFGASVTVEF